MGDRFKSRLMVHCVSYDEAYTKAVADAFGSTVLSEDLKHARALRAVVSAKCVTSKLCVVGRVRFRCVFVW